MKKSKRKNERNDIKFYNIRAFSEIIGVSIPTLRNWDKNNTLKAFRLPTGRLYYTEEHIRLLTSNQRRQ